MSRNGDWFLSSRGNKIYPLDFQIEDVDIEEIAHSLSNICRFGGHCRSFYSVAQHSTIVAQSVSKEFALVGLLHDATEAYVGDMIRPLKTQKCMSGYRELEDSIRAVICMKFNIPIMLPDEVYYMDSAVLLAEKRDLLITHDHEWQFPQCKYPAICPFPETPIVPMLPNQAKKEFLDYYWRIKQ